MNLPRAGVKSDFRRFKELNNELDELEEEFSALNLSLPLQLGDLQNLETTATNLVAAINELLTQIKEKTSYGVVSGLTVTAQDVPDLTVKVTSGIIYMQNGDRFITPEAPGLVIFEADATNPRIDIIFVNSTGTLGYLPGTAAAEPTAPLTPEGGQLIAEIAVAANATAIETANITDKRKTIDELEANLTALSLGLSIQVGNVENLETVATNLVGAINELLTQIKEKTSYGVVSGLNVTAQDEPDMTVNVSSGIIYMQDGERFEVEADTMAVVEADEENLRIDIIYINGTGVVSYMPGIAAANPEAPETPSSSQLLAEIAVAKNATAIEAANIADKRKLIVS